MAFQLISFEIRMREKKLPWICQQSRHLSNPTAYGNKLPINSSPSRYVRLYEVPTWNEDESKLSSKIHFIPFAPICMNWIRFVLAMITTTTITKSPAHHKNNLLSVIKIQCWFFCATFIWCIYSPHKPYIQPTIDELNSTPHHLIVSCIVVWCIKQTWANKKMK